MPVGIMKLKGADGTVYTVPALKGDACMWYSGTAVTGTGTGIAATVAGSKLYDMYINTTTKRVYQATSANVWDYKFTITMHNDARIVVGNSNAGYAADQCDFLCDGTDDQVEINAAIAALPETGGKVVILDGAYNITANITITKDYVELCGTNNSRLTFANASYIDFDTKRHCTIHDLTLIGTQTTDNKPILCVGGIWDRIYNICTSKGSIQLNYVCDMILTNCDIGYQNGANRGLDIKGGTLIIISNNQFSGNCVDIYATYADRLTIINNISDAFSDTGIYLSDCYRAVVTDNNFYSQVNKTTRGLCVIKSQYILIANNHITVAYASSADCCVTINNVKQSTFTNNLIISYAPSVAPVQVIGGCNYINCANNTLITDTSYNIADSGNTNVTITGTVRWPLNI